MMELTVSEAREKLSDIISEVAFGKKQVVLTRNGKKIIAIISMDDFEQLEKKKVPTKRREKT